MTRRAQRPTTIPRLRLLRSAAVDRKDRPEVAGPAFDALLLPGMAAVAGALLHDADSVEAEVVRAAARYGRDGESLNLLLGDLDRCHQMICDEIAPPETTRLAALTWAREMSGHYRHISCVDPLTGLATPEHLRSRLVEIYRGATRDGAAPGATYNLVVVTVRPRPGRQTSIARSELAASLRLMLVAEHLRRHFVRDEVIGVLRSDRLVVLSSATTGDAGLLGTSAAGPLGLGRIEFGCRTLALPDDVADALAVLVKAGPGHPSSVADDETATAGG